MKIKNESLICHYPYFKLESTSGGRGRATTTTNTDRGRVDRFFTANISIDNNILGESV
jgi:hypothetical protein